MLVEAALPVYYLSFIMYSGLDEYIYTKIFGIEEVVQNNETSINHYTSIDLELQKPRSGS